MRRERIAAAALALSLSSVVMIALLSACHEDTKRIYVRGDTLGTVLQRGLVRVGVRNADLPGFFTTSTAAGLEADLGRALAAALFGDETRVEFVPTTASTRFSDLRSGAFDVLIRSTTRTLSRDTTEGVSFTAAYFYDGQGIMAPTSTVTSTADLAGKTVGVIDGTTSEANLEDFRTASGIGFTIDDGYADSAALFSAYATGTVDAVSSDRSNLNGQRTLLPVPAAHALLPEVLAKEPLAAAVRHGDDVWVDVVQWVIFAMWQAEEWGINQANVDTFLTSSDQSIRRLLGVDGDLGPQLGLPTEFAYDVIRLVGNYDDVYDLHLNPTERGQNRLYTNGGLLYSPPFR